MTVTAADKAPHGAFFVGVIPAVVSAKGAPRANSDRMDAWIAGRDVSRERLERTDSRQEKNGQAQVAPCLAFPEGLPSARVATQGIQPLQYLAAENIDGLHPAFVLLDAALECALLLHHRIQRGTE